MRRVVLLIAIMAGVLAPIAARAAQGATPAWKELLHCNQWCQQFNYSCVAFHDKIWLLGGTYQGSSGPMYVDIGDVWNTSDGKNWNYLVSRPNWDESYDGEFDIVFNNKIFCFRLSEVWSSPDGITWTLVSQSLPWGFRHYYGIAAFNNKLLVMGGETEQLTVLNDIWSSEDGQQWTPLSASAPWQARAAFGLSTFNGKLWILGGYAGWDSLNDVWCSPDGLSWTEMTSSAPWEVRDSPAAFPFNGRLWMLGGSGARGKLCDMWSSADGGEWAPEGYGPYAAPTVSFRDKVYLIGTDEYDTSLSTKVWCTSDGRNWSHPYSAASWPPCYEIGGASLDDKLLMLGYSTAGNPLVSSTDGINWVQSTLLGAWHFQASGQGYSCLSFNKKMWIPSSMDDGSAYLNSSLDGINWSSVPFTTGPTPVWGFVSASFKGEMYLLGGQQWSYTAPLSTVWHSPDGVNWSTYDAPWPGSWAGSGAVLGDKLYMFVGGTQQSWSTSDGLTWTRRNDVPWPARTYGMAVSSGDRIWVLGGQTPGGAALSDVWYTTDGNTWTQFTANAPWYPRYDHFATFWNNKLWVIGGTTLNAEGPEAPLNDVWFMDLSGQPETFTVDAGPGWYTVGNTLTLTARTTNTVGPLTYQWFQDGQAISDATDATYQVAQAGESDSGSYTCQITTVYDPPHVTAPVPITVFPPGALPGPSRMALAFLLMLSSVLALRRRVRYDKCNGK